MTTLTQVRLSGFGGQGIVLAGMLLGQAGVLDGKFVTGSNSYGAQARGSGCKAEVVFSDGPIDFPHLIVADILVAMSQSAYNQYCADVRAETGLILYDRGQVQIQRDLPFSQVAIPASEWSLKKLQITQTANIVFLGALIQITKLVSPRSMRKAIPLQVPEHFKKLNLEALKIGMQLGRQAHG
ncbi:MAG: 2-oxoglutarate ferredoxin oxidoreductase subunit gamma [Desulfobacca sp.]|nr:2-oxoglutarate ferredoxin oxidoreductase subunit gamma [Desulfobacca sp.]